MNIIVHIVIFLFNSLSREFRPTLHIRTYFLYPAYLVLYPNMVHLHLSGQTSIITYTLHPSPVLSYPTHPTKTHQPHNQPDLCVRRNRFMKSLVHHAQYIDPVHPHTSHPTYPAPAHQPYFLLWWGPMISTSNIWEEGGVLVFQIRIYGCYGG